MVRYQRGTKALLNYQFVKQFNWFRIHKSKIYTKVNACIEFGASTAIGQICYLPKMIWDLTISNNVTNIFILMLFLAFQ